MISWRRARQRQSSPLVTYLDWASDEQLDLVWKAGYLDNRSIIPRSASPSIGDRIEAVRNTYPYIDGLAYVRSGHVVNITHSRVTRLATAVMLDPVSLKKVAEQHRFEKPTVVIAPMSVVTLAEEEDARRLASELSVAYAIYPLSECLFEWEEPA